VITLQKATELVETAALVLAEAEQEHRVAEGKHPDQHRWVVTRRAAVLAAQVKLGAAMAALSQALLER
jgi:hypothetical protein